MSRLRILPFFVLIIACLLLAVGFMAAKTLEGRTAIPFQTATQTQPSSFQVQTISDILIDPIPSHGVNESFAITGRTGLPPGTELGVEVYRRSWNPGIPPQKDPWYDHLGKTTIVTMDPDRGSTWSYWLNSTGAYPDEYIFSITFSGNTSIANESVFYLGDPCPTNTSSPGTATMSR